MDTELINLLKTVLKKELEASDKPTEEKTVKTKGKRSKQKTKPTVKKPEIPYSQTPDIIKEMSKEENIKRFGFLFNAENPYQAITGKAITTFYQDNGIKAFKTWHMSYKNKDLIINQQLQGQPEKTRKASLKARIEHIEQQLNKERKPTGKSFGVNHIDKIHNALIEQMERLEHELNE